MNSIQNIILVRHGETTKDKSDSNRRLTSRGKADMKLTAKKIQKFINCDVTLTSANNNRAIESAEILSTCLKIPFKKDISLEVDSFLIKSWDPIKKLQVSDTNYKDRDLTEIYFDLYQKDMLPKDVTSPEIVGQKFYKIIKNLKLTTKCLIIVANGGSLESAAFYQSFYVPKFGDKLYQKPINYSEFIILEHVK